MVRIGISGWRYPPWRGVFYPEDLPQRRELEYASRQVNSIEINGTFYSLQRPEYFAAWREQTPEDFVFSVKGTQFITHIRRLNDIEGPLANFMASGLLALKEKLGPILWQFPPSLKYDATKFETFFKLLPRDTKAAALLAKGHDGHLKGRALTETDANRPLRHAVEFRHKSFLTDEFIDQLRRHDVSLVIADTARRFPMVEDITADFVYIRLHGDEELYTSGYSATALERWASRIELWKSGSQPTDAHLASTALPPKKTVRDIHVYFDNDIKVHAPYDAITLAKRLGITWQKDHENEPGEEEKPARKKRTKKS